MDNRVLNAIFEKVENEPYANKLGMKLLKLDYGYSLVEMHFTENVANIFGIPHGGAIFSLVDEAFETAFELAWYGCFSVEYEHFLFEGSFN